MICLNNEQLNYDDINIIIISGSSGNIIIIIIIIIIISMTFFDQSTLNTLRVTEGAKGNRERRLYCHVFCFVMFTKGGNCCASLFACLENKTFKMGLSQRKEFAPGPEIIKIL